MAWVTPRTWTTGDLATAAMLNQDVRDNPNALAKPYLVWCERSTQHPDVVTSTSTPLQWNADIDDDYNQHNPSDNTGTPPISARLVAAVSGLWFYAAKVAMNVGATGTRELLPHKNNVSLGISANMDAASFDISPQSWLNAFGLVQLNAGDYLTVNLWQTQGTNIAVLIGSNFGMWRVSLL